MNINVYYYIVKIICDYYIVFCIAYKFRSRWLAGCRNSEWLQRVHRAGWSRLCGWDHCWEAEIRQSSQHQHGNQPASQPVPSEEQPLSSCPCQLKYNSQTVSHPFSSATTASPIVIAIVIAISIATQPHIVGKLRQIKEIALCFDLWKFTILSNK